MKTILITGCSSGFGQVSALEFARSGAQVYATARRIDACADLLEAAQREKLALDVMPLDVSDSGQIKTTAARVIDDCGRLDVLINNAGVAMPGALEDLSDGDMDDVMEVNFFAPVRLSKAVLPQMRKQGHGRIIMVSSLSALVGLPGEAMYSASKAALEAAAEGLRHEVERFNIFVSVIEPGLFNTGMPDKMAKGFVCPADSAYRPLIEHLQKRIKQRSGRGDDPLRVAELLMDIVNDEKPAFRYPAGMQAKNILKSIHQLTEPSRRQFIRDVNETIWWSTGGDKPEST